MALYQLSYTPLLIANHIGTNQALVDELQSPQKLQVLNCWRPLLLMLFDFKPEEDIVDLQK